MGKMKDGWIDFINHASRNSAEPELIMAQIALSHYDYLCHLFS